MRDDIAGMVTEGTEDEQSEEQADGDRAEHGPAAVIPGTDNLSDRSQEAGERVPFDSEHLPSSSDPVPVEAGESSAQGDSIPPDVPGPESEVAAPAGGAAHLPASVDGPEVPEDGELEELTLPSSIQALEQLPEGSAVGPDNQIAVVRRRGQRGRVNSYLATMADPSGQPVTVELLEGPADHEGLRRQAEVLSQVHYAMLPHLHATWEQDGRRYLAVDLLEGPTLTDVLNEGPSAETVVSIGLQLSQVLRRLQAAGWALVGLSPDGICMGQPIRVTRLDGAMRIGEQPPHAFQVPGYSAPELAQPGAITGKEDVYTLGAILYRGLGGEPVPEGGAELTTLSARLRLPGSPQLLGAALAPASERVSLEGFYQRLLAFKRRLSAAPLSLQVAGGTSIGLNETRLTNEDACGYVTWCSAYEGHVAYNATLCVVDGMGGMAAGEAVSTAALRAVLRETAAYSNQEISTASGTDRESGQDLAASSSTGQPYPPLAPVNLVQSAAQAAYEAGRGREVGATITCVVIQDGELSLGHVGDTRAYLWRGSILTQLTRDHSLVAAMVAGGMITKEEARGHPESNKVLRSLGGQRTLPDEYVDGLTVVCGQEKLRLRDRDRLLLCSDGVWGMLDDEALLRILTESPDCQSAVDRVICGALEGGAPDNATVIIAECRTMRAS